MLSTLLLCRLASPIANEHHSYILHDTIALPHLSHHVPHTATCGCPDGTSRCIMAATITFNPPSRWSQCSRNQLVSGYNDPRLNLDRCLFNEPTSVVGDPTCGNGIMEDGEACDCGSLEVCTYMYMATLLLHVVVCPSILHAVCTYVCAFNVHECTCT